VNWTPMTKQYWRIGITR